MISITLDDLELYRLMRQRRADNVAAVLCGLLIVMSGDASEFLSFIRNQFPGFTGHDLQHSWRVVSRIESILTPTARNDLSSVEIFSLIVAAAFHDVGMISSGITVSQVRDNHHLLSEQFLLDYMKNRLSLISEYHQRLAPCIGFVAKAHGLAWDEMVASELFKRPERIMGQQVRTNILAVLLRIGDLLDLDSERSCDALQRHAAIYFADQSARIHHSKHKHVDHHCCPS